MQGASEKFFFKLSQRWGSPEVNGTGRLTENSGIKIRRVKEQGHIPSENKEEGQNSGSREGSESKGGRGGGRKWEARG